MGMKEKLEEQIRRKRQEIQELQGRIREAGAYIQALEEASKLLPRENVQRASVESVLRPGSGAHRAYVALQAAGKPLHIVDIMKAINMPVNKKSRLAIGGTLSRYSRNGQVFRRTAPNTFSIMDNANSDEPPEGFGAIADEESPDLTNLEEEVEDPFR